MIESNLQDNLVILIDGGHTEYSPVETFMKPPLEVIAIGMQNDLDEDIEESFDLAMKLAESPNNWLTPGDRDDCSWTTLLRLSGSFSAHVTSFTFTAATLMPSLDPSGYRPGGDDDYFDYYPSGLRMLREWALDLDEAAQSYTYADFYKTPGFLGIYHNVLRDFLHREKHRNTTIDISLSWDNQEEVTERVDELARDLRASRDTIIDQIH